MNTRLCILSTACVLALTACGGTPAPTPADTATTPNAADSQPAPPPEAPTPQAPEMTAAPAATAEASGPAAVVADCSTTIEGNDALKFNVGSITVPASCSDFTINLKHVGQMPAAAMGHNVVVSKLSDVTGVDADGMGAGMANSYIKAGDPRVIAHTKVIGGGESTSVTFAVSKIQGDGPYEFFCSFPGHEAAGMKGSIEVR